MPAILDTLIIRINNNAHREEKMARFNFHPRISKLPTK